MMERVLGCETALGRKALLHSRMKMGQIVCIENDLLWIFFCNNISSAYVLVYIVFPLQRLENVYA